MRSALLDYGFDVEPVPDGQIHRFKGPGDKRPNCWYVWHGDHGAFGSWKDGLTVPWSETSRRREVVSRRRDTSTSAPKSHAEAAQKARDIWRATSIAKSHPYLEAKHIPALGTRIHDGKLIVPMTVDTHIHSLQFITPQFKWFLKGGRVKGCYFPIGKMTNPLWVAEGFATAASVHLATGDAVVCAFNAGNMLPVAQLFLGMQLTVYIAADNDDAGLRAAEQCLDAGAAFASWPDTPKADWNDVWQTHDAECVQELLYGA